VTIPTPTRHGRPSRPLASPLRQMSGGGPVDVDRAVLVALAAQVGLRVFATDRHGNLIPINSTEEM
jgi:hypothetical protein